MSYFIELTPALKGAVIGFILALILAIFGFWKSLMILGFTVAGYFIGKKIFVNRETLRDFLDKILPPGKFH